MYFLRLFLLFSLTITFYAAYGQQDVNFHLNATFLSGKNILKVKRDFHDPYLWVLAQNNQVYRINSITQTIDDYTSKFSAYNNLSFIDIAGLNQDTVFIATNSLNVLEYKKGQLKVIGAANGVPGVVNSIGIDAAGRGNVFINSDYIALFATANGICRYNYKTETIQPIPLKADSRILEATYRSEMMYPFECRCYPDSVTHFPALELVDNTTWVGELWLGGNSFGQNLKSAFYTSGGVYNPYIQFSLYSNQFWATETGLFQNYWNYSYITGGPYPYYHYLKGIDISKITSIYGLTAFGDQNFTGLIKENLLIGSSNGLYFSNSKYRSGGVSKYSFFFCNELGNKPINDICVNATSYTKPICEDGVWIASTNGLYLLKPDYGPYINTTQKIPAITFNGQDDTVTSLEVCSNLSVTASISQFAYLGNTIQWYKNGIELPNQSDVALNITQSGDYNAILYDPCSDLHFETNHLKVRQIAAPVFSFNYADVLNYCDGSTASLSTDNNSLYKYRWYTNGVLNGFTTSSFNITKSGKYKVEVSACSNNWVASKEVQVNFIKFPTSVINADKSGYCLGDKATLSTDFINDGTYTINWYRNGNILSGNQNKTSIITTDAGNYSIGVASNLTSCNQFSNPYTLSFDMPPNISIQRVVNTTLCDGEPVILNATYSSGSIKWSTGETTDKIIVRRSGNYIAVVTTSTGCSTVQNVDLQLFSNPILTLSSATLCPFDKQSITLTAPSGFVKYEWNGQLGSSIYTTGLLGAVNLTVTDNNGCKGSQTITISSQCNDIHIPNTFTPNADGINDTWAISGLDGDVSAKVSIFNRYGVQLFQSQGYSLPWDGSYKGKKLPTGTYYYIISAHGAKQALSGPVTIIY